ncbi:MAG: FMN-binding protein [Gammaproteobacteria bacterium]|nr:FMN-binding protein [Gammaproteobacteria bacterium]MDP7455256.1 FMN-binding protein [Gammaproteobacteria bacterium]HJO12147.1 FMN-binding protein [Gammaproteobacteria bacterium]
MLSRRSTGFRAVLLLMVILPIGVVAALGDYITAEDYLNRVFWGELPASNTVWLTGERKQRAEEILGHKPGVLRMRYWGDQSRSAWIVDEIGKTEPITIGIVIGDSKIEEIEVLAFRESRGWEIKHDFFTRQFRGAFIEQQQRLDRSIDGISGATLSVNAMTKVSRLVLYLAESIGNPKTDLY